MEASESKYDFIRTVVLTEAHEATGATRHFVHGKLAGKPFSVSIVRFKDATGFYLIRYDDEGAEITDTLHDSVEEAMEQAKSEYKINKDEWGQQELAP